MFKSIELSDIELEPIYLRPAEYIDIDADPILMESANFIRDENGNIIWE